jgi:hypothetical protein
MPLTITQQDFYTPHILAAVGHAKAETVAMFGARAEWHDTREDRRWALEITVRACWALAQKFPNASFGLEAYDGASGVAYRDGGPRYSFDIILGSKDGPSNDVLVGGLHPASQGDRDSGHPPSQWAADWRAPERPTGVDEPAPDPPQPPVDPPVPPGDDLAAVHAKLDLLIALVREGNEQVYHPARLFT